MRRIQFLLPLFLLAFTFSACDEENEPAAVLETQTIADLAAASPSLSTLVTALQRTNLVSALRADGPITVLAPTNAAFDSFLAANNFDSLDEVPTDLLTQVLLNHVLSGSLQSNDLSRGYYNTSATSAVSGGPMSIYVSTSNGVSFNGISQVTNPNIEADNGIIHVVDAVIGLPTVVDMVSADTNLTALLSVLTRNDLTTDFVSILSTPFGTSPAPFTVFAPTNAAFGDLRVELGIGTLSEIDEPTLNATLTYHVVGGSNVGSSGLTDNMTISTLGGDITANVTGGASLTDSNGRVSMITLTDIQTNNGIIHIIDKVILP